MAVSSIIKLGGKLAIVGSAVYFTASNSICDKNEYANAAINRVKETLPETTELYNQLPSSNNLVEKWNRSVQSVFTTVADSDKHLNNAVTSISEKLTSTEIKK